MAVKIRIKKKAALGMPEPSPVKRKAKTKRSLAVMDGMCEMAVDRAPNTVIPWWLMASYLYYIHDDSLLSDGLYDNLARLMLKNWPKLEHKHKHLITVDDLEAGSLSRLVASEYPVTTRGAVSHLVRSEWGVSLSTELNMDKPVKED